MGLWNPPLGSISWNLRPTIARGAQLFDFFFWWRSWVPENVFGAKLLHQKKQSKSWAPGTTVERKFQEIYTWVKQAIKGDRRREGSENLQICGTSLLASHRYFWMIPKTQLIYFQIQKATLFELIMLLLLLFGY